MNKQNKKLTYLIFLLLFFLIIIFIHTKNNNAQEYIVNDPNITFKWEYPNPPPDLKEFKLLESENGTNFIHIKDVSSDKLTTKYKITSENIYYYTVIAVDYANLRSNNSNIIKIIYDNTPPPPVQNLEKGDIEKIIINNTINLTFNKPLENNTEN